MYAATPAVELGSSPSAGVMLNMAENSRSTAMVWAPGQEQSLFDIEKEGDPSVDWRGRYGSTVNEDGAYFQLRSGNLPTATYPSRIPSEKIIGNGEMRYPCHVDGCQAEAFRRHYDLHRHYVLIHNRSDTIDASVDQDKKETRMKEEGGNRGSMNCDYDRCSYKHSFRKDHMREHYREFHGEDLIKPSQPKSTKQTKKKLETTKEFLASRSTKLSLIWWRCARCLDRVQVSASEYTCPGCKSSCEPERVEWRKNRAKEQKTVKSVENTEEFVLDSSSAEFENTVIGCGQCEDGWVLNEMDDNSGAACPRCCPQLLL